MGWPRQLRTASGQRQNRKESFLSVASRSSSFREGFPNGPLVWISGTIPTLLHQIIIMMTMTPSSETLCSAGGQVKEQINRAHEKAIGNIGLQRNGRCLRSTDGVSDISATLGGFRSNVPRHPALTECFCDWASFTFSRTLERHRDGFEAIQREKHLDSHPKMTRDLQGEFQAWFVVAAFEITDCLVVNLDRFSQLPPRYAALRTKNSNSIV